MSIGEAALVVPMRFAGADLLIQASQVTVAGSEPTSVRDKVADAYERAEPTIVRIASAVAGTVTKFTDEPVRPKQVEVNFGLAVSVQGDVVLLRGTTEATLAITLTYDAVS
jgi:Trypsin-co-occurring domain 1